jgi:hypothetical protein
MACKASPVVSAIEWRVVTGMATWATSTTKIVAGRRPQQRRSNAPTRPLTSLVERLRLPHAQAMGFARRGSEMRRTLILTAACLLVLSVGPVSPAVAGGRAGYGCPPAFDLGGLTLAETLALPRIQAGLAAGVYTVEELTAVVDFLDHNDNGVICFKDVGALNGDASTWQYEYNAVDDNASVPER